MHGTLFCSEELQETKRLLDEEQKEGEKKTTTINQVIYLRVCILGFMS